jgi:hypothetical protein
VGYRINVTPITPPAAPLVGVLGAFVAAALRGEQEAYRAALIAAPVSALVTITTLALPSGVVNKPYAFTLTATGGAQPYTWAQSGALPTGISFTPATGVLSGTPIQAGFFSLTFTATDANAISSVPSVLGLLIQSTLIGSFTYATPGDGPWVL